MIGTDIYRANDDHTAGAKPGKSCFVYISEGANLSLPLPPTLTPTRSAVSLTPPRGLAAHCPPILQSSWPLLLIHTYSLTDLNRVPLAPIVDLREETVAENLGPAGYPQLLLLHRL